MEGLAPSGLILAEALPEEESASVLALWGSIENSRV